MAVSKSFCVLRGRLYATEIILIFTFALRFDYLVKITISLAMPYRILIIAKGNIMPIMA
jgi:hypothetical protein